MKIQNICHCFLAALLITSVFPANAQQARLFRISGPAATKIMTLRPDGSLVWSNALAGTNYTVQAANSLAGGTNWASYIQLPAPQSVSTNQIISFNSPAGMAFIPAGSFTIGDALDGEGDAPLANVYVSGFYMDKNLVSFTQWQAIYNWAINHGYGFVDAGAGKAANHPVQSIDWFDSLKWCNARSQSEGLTPVYYTDAGLTQIYTNGQSGITVYANWTANGYRLPTEAEWEKAARGGLTGQRFPWGNTISESQANYEGYSTGFSAYTYDLGPNGYNTNFVTTGNSFPYTSPVGWFAPNGYGLYDMTGNVWQYCWDWYAGTPLPAGSAYLGGSDPHGPTQTTYHAMRGCPWNGDAKAARTACRSWNLPITATITLSFRCVRRL